MPIFYGLLNHLPIPKLATIEVASSPQLPQIHILGLPGPSVAEAKDRIRSAIHASSFSLPSRKFLINISPSDVRKQGTLFDLGMALSLIFHRVDSQAKLDETSHATKEAHEKKYLVLGELTLDGKVRATRQVLRALHVLKLEDLDGIILPEDDKPELEAILSQYFNEESSLTEKHLYLVKDLKSAYLNILVENHTPWLARTTGPTETELREKSKRYSQPIPKLIPSLVLEALKFAATGNHHTLLLGPKGTGKSTAVDVFERLIPMDSKEELREWEMIKELAQDSTHSHFRRLNPSIRPQTLLGGFNHGQFRPGELALAHSGALIADEFPEWHRDTREALRQPLQDQVVHLQRREGEASFPARFTLLATGNLCPCGGVFRERMHKYETRCTCTQEHRTSYLKKIEGPLLDRIDIRVLLGGASERASYEESRIQDEIAASRIRAKEWYGTIPGQMSPHALECYLEDHPKVLHTLDCLSHESLRDRHKILRLALTQSCFLSTQREPTNNDFINLQKFRFRPCDWGHSFLG